MIALHDFCDTNTFFYLPLLRDGKAVQDLSLGFHDSTVAKAFPSPCPP